MSCDHVQIVYTSLLKSLRTGLEKSNFFNIQMGTNGDFWGLMGTKLGGVATQKKPRKTEKNPFPNLKFAVAFGFFGFFFSVFFGFFGIFRFFFRFFFRYFSVFFGFFCGTFSVFFRSELRQEIPAIQKSCQQ